MYETSKKDLVITPSGFDLQPSDSLSSLTRLTRWAQIHLVFDIGLGITTCVACPQKHVFLPSLCRNWHLEPHLPVFMHDIPVYCHASNIFWTSTTIRWIFWSSHYGNVAETIVFVPSTHREFVTEVWKCFPRSSDLVLLTLWPIVFFSTAPPSTSREYSQVRIFFENNLTIYQITPFFKSTTLNHKVFDPHLLSF